MTRYESGALAPADASADALYDLASPARRDARLRIPTDCGQDSDASRTAIRWLRTADESGLNGVPVDNRITW